MIKHATGEATPEEEAKIDRYQALRGHRKVKRDPETSHRVEVAYYQTRLLMKKVRGYIHAAEKAHFMKN